MRSRNLFLLVYLLGNCFGTSSAQRNETCTTRETCGEVPDGTSHFLQCVGLPSTDTGRDHMRRLKGILEAMMDVYTFMRSSMTGVPLLSLEGALSLNPTVDPFQNEALVEMWMEFKIKPLLNSITKHFLSCLSTKNFSCSTYQTVVRELSHHFSEMNPVRQKWIYTFFMYPFLSGDGVAGCVSPEENSEEWLMKNFGAFRAMARMKDFSKLNMVFSGLQVLHLLSPAQKAELMLRPEVAGLDNGTLTLVFHSLLTGGSGPPPTTSPGGGQNWTGPGYPSTHPPKLTYDPYPPPPPHNSFKEVVNGFMMAFRPIRSFVHDFVSFTHERDVSEIRSTTLTQFLLNWTLAELADLYRPQNTSVVPERPEFDVTNVEDWYQQVVIPVLQRFLPNNPEALMHQNITLAFHQVFYLDHDMDEETSEILDVCSITLDKSPCGLTDAVQNVAHVLHCAARTNLTMSEATIMRLIVELTERLNLLIKELSTANFKELASDFAEIFGETDSPSLTQEHLNDPDFIKLWFKIKLMPLLPGVPTDLLSCLSTKNFSCPVYQTIVTDLSKHMSFMDADPIHSHNIYQHFIYAFLLHHNTSDPHCISSATDSAEWIEKNFGFFSRFASMTDFYNLNPQFSGTEVLHLLSPEQIAQMLLLPLPTPPEKDVVINQVFDFLLESPEERKFPEVLYSLVQLAKEVNPPCGVYKQIFERLYGGIASLPPDLEPVTWAGIDELVNIAPEECVPENITCPVTLYNSSNICRRINSSELHSYLSTSMEVSCNFTLETYACAQLEDFTPSQLASLLKCNLPGNSSHSKVLWKMLLTKLSFVLDPALDMLANMSVVVPSASEVLDVIGEIRVSMLTDEQLMNSGVIGQWFSGRLSGFLPSASGRFLHCLSLRNLSCHSYQQILQVFTHHFDDMTLKQQHVVLKEFVLRFLSHSGPGCVSLSNGSAEWLMKNLGPFSSFLSLKELLHLNPDFNPLEVIRLLTPKQSAELLVLTLPTLPEKDVIINMLFDYLTESPDNKKLPEFLSYVVMFIQQGNLSCSSYKTLFDRLDLAMASVSLDVASSITHTKMALSSHLPPGCIIYSGECNVIMTNETDICVGVNSTMLQLHLDSGLMNGHFCHFAVEEFACASLSALTAQDLAAMLACDRSSNSSGSRPVWKLLLSKASHVLDGALDLLTNTTLDPRSPAVSMVLDSIRELRLDTFSIANINDPAVIQLWFNQRLRPFLPAVSPDFLSCLTTKGLNCSTYQHIVQTLSSLQPHMTHARQMSIYTHFIKVFLTSNNTAGPGCVSLSNGSAEWLMKNLGPFSSFLSLKELLHLNPDFNPLEVIRLLTPKQSAELLVLALPTLPEKDVIINMLFDYLTESPDNKKLPEFLSYLVMFIQQGNLSCSSYKTLFDRLDLAMASVSPDVASSITHTKMALSSHLPPGCIIYSGECNVIMTNETDICVGVNSTMLQLHLDSGMMNGHFCHFAVEEFACASLSALTAQDLAAMLACDRSSNSSGSRPVWKLLLSKASHVLDGALDLLTNTTLDPRNPAVSMVLDSIRELRLDTFSIANINDPALIQLWFNQRLRPFLPAVSPDFLSCLTTKGLNCSTYQHIVQTLSSLQPHMTDARQMSIYTHFIKVFLTSNNTAGPGCVSLSNGSAEWLMKNLGPFSSFLSLKELLHLNPDFNPLEVIRLLTPKQSAELLVLTLPTLPEKDVIINMLFDYLTESPDNKKLPEFLSYVVMFIQQENISCSSYKTLFDRLDLATATVSPDVASSITHTKMALSSHLPPGCTIYSGECNVIMTNETDICVGVNSTMLQLHLDSGMMNGHFCHFAVEEFACASLSALTAQDLAAMLACDRSSNSSGSRPVWKLLLSKASHVLDGALDLLTNTTLDPRSPAVSMVLDSIRELRLDTFSIANINDPALIQLWFNQRLRPFLPAVSPDFLSCLTTKGLNCSTYQHIVQTLSSLQPHMTLARQMSIYTHFIKVFLTSNNTAGPGCVSLSNGSAEWLMKNLGPFSSFLSLKELLHLNPDFNPLAVIRLLTPKQSAELLVLALPTLPEKDVIINMLFDYLTESPDNKKLPEFLSYLVMFIQQGNLSCSSYKTLFDRLDLAMASVSLDVASSITHTKMALSSHLPPGCTIYSGECNVIMTNETDICVGVNSTMLQLHLDSGLMNGHFCHFAVEEFACASLSALTAQDLAAMLACDRSSNSSGSRPVWKLLLSKASHVLDGALDLLTNTTLDPRSPAVSMVLDSIRELRLDTFSTANINDPAVIQLWFNQRLRPFLPAVSPDFLSCLTTKGLNCSTYQHIVQTLSSLQPHMTHARQMSIYTHFIKVFLTSNNTAGPGCVSLSNGSAEWLMKNLGPFSSFLSLKELLHLNPHFNPLEVIRLLTPKQSAELLVLTLPTLPEKDVIINMLFDYLTESPDNKKLPEFLSYLVMFIQQGNLSCSSYKTLFDRLDLAMATVSPDVASSITHTKMALSSHLPPGCTIYSGECNVIMTNETDICVGVNSTMLQLHLDSGMMNGHFCHFAVEEFACASLSALTAQDLAAMLACDRSSNSSGSRPVWKLLLSKASHVLDGALDLLTNTTLDPRNPAVSMVLDSIRELRLDTFSIANINDPAVIQLWFNQRLRPFLPAVSPDFLSCLTTKGLNCSAYQHIVQTLSSLQPHMTLARQMSIYTHFIKVFLTSNNTAGPGCVSLSNGSAEWLMKNLGPFSSFLSLKELLHLNPHFNPLEVIRLLTPKQSAELLVLTLPTLPEKDVIINMLFDYLTESPDNKKLPEFLSYLVMFIQQGNLSCSSYKTLFDRLDLAMASVSLDVASSITHTKMALSSHLPPGCIIYSGECNVIMTNETDICVGVNSTMLQLHLDSGLMNGHFCHFAVEEFACASLSALTAQDLAAMLACDRSSNSSGSRPVWKLLLSKASHVLDGALDLLTNTTLDPRNPAVSMVLDSIRELRLDTFSIANINDPGLIQLWFNQRLRPFLPAVSPDFLSCLTTKGLNCSTYQHIVQILSSVQPHMTLARQMSIYTHFIKVFLTRNKTADPSCSLHINNSGEWLQKNLGGFSVLASFSDLQMLKSHFSAMEALPQLTVRQLAEVSATPGQLTSAAQVTMVMKHIPNQLLAAFFDDFSPAITGHENMFPSPVRSAMLQVVFDRANLSDHSVGDSVVSLWLHNRLRPLLVNLSPSHVAPFFRIVVGRNCSIQQQGVEDLNSVFSSLSEVTQTEIHNQIIQALKGPVPLQCYGDNYNNSFYTFLERSFMGFQFPNLTTFLSLMPHNKQHQLLNSMPPSALGDFLRRPDVVDNDAELCVIYNNYMQTPLFLETESLPAAVRRPTLPCVWPIALSSSKRSEVNAWFDRRLHNYLVFLTKSLISPQRTHNASCLAFQKLVSVLGEYNYNVADFTRQDVFNTIRAYLTSATEPRCYNPSDPELNSTAWFAEYIGLFMPFLTLEDLQTFGSAQVIQVFTVNPLNIDLLNHSALPLNLTNYYTELIYQQDSNFNPLLLPLLWRCVALGPAFSQLTAEESVIVLHNLTAVCTDLDPQIAAALADNFGDNIDATAISALGNESTGLSTGQITMIKPQDLLGALSVLSSVTGWNDGQAKAIIQSLVSSGVMQINGASSLFMLGSLVVGVPATTFSSINGSQLLTASKNPSFLGYMTSAPLIVRQIFITQIISVDSNSEKIIQNVPDELATEIPRALLLGFSNSASVVTTLNKKKWKRQQVELFFSVIGAETATTMLGSPDSLSSSVLQGFTCTGVRTISKVQIKRLIKACRRKGKNKVTLVETQLTCMYNYIKGDSDTTSFDLFPPDMLLYYDYSLVPRANCRSYFEQLADADFSIFSSALNYKLTALFANARSCLGITSTSLTEDTISVLGNMCCTLDGSYIENSDPSILEKLKNCPDLTNDQTTAVETLLLSGKTQYGAPATWNEQTLEDLGMLPLYLTSTFYENFNKKTKQGFLRYFLKVMKTNGVDKQKRRRLKKEIRKSIRTKSKRSIENECTVGTITQVTISDETFPFNYDDINQFNCCLSATTVKNNLDSITGKVDEEEYLKIVLSKLREAYAASGNIPESQVQVLGLASRVATVDDINMWIITEIDTLSALMDASNGQWDPSLAKAIITKYLSKKGNKLGSAELNAIGGANLCSLDVDVLKNISQQSLKNADALSVSDCTTEKKKELFTIARQGFDGNTRSATVPVASYQLIQSYLAGANTDYIQTLAASNISMDMATLTSLDENVVLDLTVSEVRGLLGTNLASLKSYENQTLIQRWISTQYQSELDTLGLGIVGGKASSTASTSAPATSKSTNPSSNTTASSSNATKPTTKSPATINTNPPIATNPGSGSSSSTTKSPTTTGSSGSRIRADAGFSFLVLIAVLVASQHVLV